MNQALEVFQNLETRWQAGRTLYELGELAQTQNNTLQANTHFSHALILFEAIGAVPDAVRTHKALGH